MQLNMGSKPQGGLIFSNSPSLIKLRVSIWEGGKKEKKNAAHRFDEVWKSEPSK
jgi:hypothetical protein